MVFAKAPIPGRVKTRLAAEIGDAAATKLYRSMGRKIVDGLRGGGYRLRICLDPPEATAIVKEWLGEEGVQFRPQVPGSLGHRLEAAFREALREAEAALVVGADAPDVDRQMVEEAFTRLEEVDLAVGPARDGGYYLLGLTSEAPGLFRGIPWSSREVLALTLQRARSLGLTVASLPVLSDVDTLEDLRARVGPGVGKRRNAGG